MYCVIKCYVHGNQARVKNTDLHHPSCTFVMYRRKSASPVLNVLKCIRIVDNPRVIHTINHVNGNSEHYCATTSLS